MAIVRIVDGCVECGKLDGSMVASYVEEFLRDNGWTLCDFHAGFWSHPAQVRLACYSLGEALDVQLERMARDAKEWKS